MSQDQRPSYLRGTSVDRFIASVEEEFVLLREGVTFARGHKAPPRQGRPPRIVWVDVGGEYDGVARPGRVQHVEELPIWRRIATIEAHVWGPDEGSTYEMVEDVIRALHRVMPGAYWPVSDEPDEGSEENRKQGFLIVLTFKVDTNVLAYSLARARPTKVVVDVEVQAALTTPNGGV